MTKTHELKIEQRYLDKLLSGEKTFEVRFNDREYKVGDVLSFFRNLGTPYGIPTTKKYLFEITDLFENDGEITPLAKNWVILSLKKI